MNFCNRVELHTSFLPYTILLLCVLIWIFNSLPKKPKDIRQEMRKRFEQQKKLGVRSIPDRIIRGLPLKSRDELPPILRALQYIYVTPELNEEVFRILETKVMKGKKK